MPNNIEKIYESESHIRAIAAIFSITFVLGLFILQLFTFPVDETILETQVRIIDLESTRMQSMFYICLLGVLATICAVSLLKPNENIFPKVRWGDQTLIAAIVISAIVLGSWSKQFLVGFLVVAVLVTVSRAGLSFSLFSGKFLSNHVQTQRIAKGFFWLLANFVFGYLVIFLVAPIATPVLIHGPVEMSAIEGHYAVTVLPGFDLICCTEKGTIEFANYGLGMPILTALALKIFSLFGIPDTALVQAVKLNQLVAVVMICILSFFANRKYSLFIMVLALGVTAFTLSNVVDSVKYPNQSGIRYIPILASLLILLLETRREQFQIWLLASSAAIFVILSPETGLAVTAGYIVATVLKRYDANRPVASIAVTLLWFGGVFVVAGVAGSILIIEPILKVPSDGLFQFISLFTTGGYGGQVNKPSMTATLLFFIATTSVLRGVWRSRNGILLSSDAYEAALGTIMLVWLMYYVNRMAEWNLWFQFVMLILLIAPRITLVNCQQTLRKPLRLGVTIPMIMACLIGGQLASSSILFAHQAESWLKWQRLGCGDEVIKDGKCLPWLRGSESELQMNALTEQHSTAETIVLSGVATYARLRGFNDGFPWYDQMVVRKEEVEDIVNWINLRGPKYILVDDPDYEIAQAAPEKSQQIQSYIPRLSSYHEVRRDSGWIVLERVNF